MAQNVGKLATRKHDGGFVHHRQKLEVAIRKELESVQGNDFLVKLFTNRNASVLFAFGPDERDPVFSDLEACEIYSFAPAFSGTQAYPNDQGVQGTLAVAVVQMTCPQD